MCSKSLQWDYPVVEGQKLEQEQEQVSDEVLMGEVWVALLEQQMVLRLEHRCLLKVQDREYHRLHDKLHLLVFLFHQSPQYHIVCWLFWQSIDNLWFFPDW
jgi:hypothetical protein